MSHKKFAALIIIPPPDETMYDVTLAPDRIKQALNYQKLFEILKISADIDLYALLREPVPASSMAQSLGTDELFVIYLLDVLCAVDLVEQTGGDGGLPLYQSTPVARQYLDSGSASYLGKGVFNDGETRRLLEQYVAEGPSTTPITTEYWSSELIKHLETIALLGGVQDAVKLIDLTGRTHLLDIGGGHGLYSIFFVQQYPGLRAVVLDLPQVIDVARENIAKYDVSARVTAVGGDYRTFESDRAFDVIFMSNVTASTEELRFLLMMSQNLLVQGGIVLLRNFVTDSTPSVWSAVSTLERYARRGKRGRARDDLIGILSESGFGVTLLYESDGVVVLQGEK